MISRVFLAYAWHSVLRNPRRSLLSMIGAGVGTAIALVATSWINGAWELQVRAASESGSGHLRVVPATWMETRDNSLRLPNWQAALQQVQHLGHVQHVAARARANGLLAFGNRTTGVEILGVDPEAEASFNRLVNRATLEGRYLLPADREQVVIGKELAKRLRVTLDDDLLVTVSGRGEMQSGMLRIVGLLATGSRDLDAAICHITSSHLETLTGFSGPGEIAVLLTDHRLIEESAERLQAALPASVRVSTWRDANPELAANADGDRAFSRLLMLIIVAVVALGITSAQLTAILERRREYGVLVALGMKGRNLVALIFLEAVLVGIGGALVAIVLGGPATLWLAIHGVDFGELLNQMTLGNVLFDPIIYGDCGLWVIGYVLAVSISATMFASLYPARFVTKTDPARALRVV